MTLRAASLRGGDVVNVRVNVGAVPRVARVVRVIAAYTIVDVQLWTKRGDWARRPTRLSPDNVLGYAPDPKPAPVLTLARLHVIQDALGSVEAGGADHEVYTGRSDDEIKAVQADLAGAQAWVSAAIRRREGAAGKRRT